MAGRERSAASEVPLDGGEAAKPTDMATLLQQLSDHTNGGVKSANISPSGCGASKNKNKNKGKGKGKRSK